MKNYIFFYLFFNWCIVVTVIKGSGPNERKPYIVYMGALPEGGSKYSLLAEHHSILAEAIGDESIARQSKIHSYGRSINGFVAMLLPHEVKRLSEKKGVVSVFPNRQQHLHTTRSWDFLEMTTTINRNFKIESDIIISVIDSGIWIESPSFNDKGIGPPPAKWKGKCQTGKIFNGCNNKVIGAQSFNLLHPEQTTTPVDVQGHGTHTASTVAGAPVEGASLYGLANGTARGGVPSARIAMYKACSEYGCEDVDILAAFDAAIADGVDIISASLGALSTDYVYDVVAIGSFHAMQKGILTSCSAGNYGPVLTLVSNVAPWITTVAANSIDRQFETVVELDNGQKFSGISLNTFNSTSFPLTSGTLASNSDLLGGNCIAEIFLKKDKVKGKHVYCQKDQEKQDEVIRNLGGKGVILYEQRLVDTANAYIIPAAELSLEDCSKIDKYINTTKSPSAIIHQTKTINVTAPIVASFSSRGPQDISQNILKPDISAPGLSILAAYSRLKSVTGKKGDNRIVNYNIMSGTSMSCPHVSAAAAYVKSFHPDWSPAAIKSALMTTATSMAIKGEEAELAYGSGQVNPTAALNPGLIYDIDEASYISFLCKQGYSSSTLEKLTGKKNQHCSSFPKVHGADGLNYPSMHLYLKDYDNSSGISGVFYRTVTNVGRGGTVYKAQIESPNGLSVKVNPNVLSFNKTNKNKSFQVVLSGKFINESSQFLSASLVWSNSVHKVRTPILVVGKFSLTTNY